MQELIGEPILIPINNIEITKEIENHTSLFRFLKDERWRARRGAVGAGAILDQAPEAGWRAAVG
jgi:hypothetical protein